LQTKIERRGSEEDVEKRSKKYFENLFKNIWQIKKNFILLQPQIETKN